MPMRQVKTEAGTLTYELCRKRVKNLNLRVRADGSIAVSAPAGVAVAAVDEFVRRKAGWIAQVEQKLADRRLPDPEYGALLGHRVPLVVEPGPPGVWPRQGALYIGVETGRTGVPAGDGFGPRPFWARTSAAGAGVVHPPDEKPVGQLHPGKRKSDFERPFDEKTLCLHRICGGP